MTILTENAAARPWHREPWPWILMAGPIAVVFAGFATLWLAIASDDGLVADDYYKRGLAINQTLSRGEAARSLGLSAEVVIDAKSGGVHVRLQGAAAPPPAALSLQLVHPTRAVADQRVALRREADGSYAGVLDLPVGGRRLVLIEDAARSWRLAGQAANGAQTAITAVPQ